MIEQTHMGNAAICTESEDFWLILRFHKSAKTDILTPKDLQIFLHQWSNKYLFWYLQSSQSMIVGGQVFQSRLEKTLELVGQPGQPNISHKRGSEPKA